MFVLGCLLAINKMSLASSHPVAVLTHASYRRSHLHQDEESTNERLKLTIQALTLSTGMARALPPWKMPLSLLNAAASCCDG